MSPSSQQRSAYFYYILRCLLLVETREQDEREITGI